MTKIFNFALKIKGDGKEGGSCDILRPCHPPKFGTCTIRTTDCVSCGCLLKLNFVGLISSLFSERFRLL